MQNKVNEIVMLENSSDTKWVQKYQELCNTVENIIEKYDSDFIEYDTLARLEKLWKDTLCIVVCKKLISYDKKHNVQTWIYSFKNDSILTVYACDTIGE